MLLLLLLLSVFDVAIIRRLNNNRNDVCLFLLGSRTFLSFLCSSGSLLFISIIYFDIFILFLDFKLSSYVHMVENLV